jgi:hypothetical protein
MNAVMAALHDREHLYKLPDSIASSIQNWRCFIGRGGRARLECIDHVTHETFTAVKAEAQAVAAHYQVGCAGRCVEPAGAAGRGSRQGQLPPVLFSSTAANTPLPCCLTACPCLLLLPALMTQTEPWPPMPTAPNLRELVDKYRPPMPRQQGMSRTTSLASQPSSSSAMMQAGGSAAPAAQQRCVLWVGPQAQAQQKV